MAAASYFDDCYFFMLCRRHPNTLARFQDHFGLSHLPFIHEMMDAAGATMFSTSDLAELTSLLDASPDSQFDLYLQDSRAQSFMFCHRPGNHYVLGIPYEFLNERELLATFKHFGAILGWGGHDDAPFTQIEDMRQAAKATQSAFLRFHQGQLLRLSMN